MIGDHELDCHVDVFLIGPSFNSDSVAKVNSFLEDLSALAFVGAPLQHVQEKIIYHTSIAKQLEKKVLSAISDAVEQQEIISYFQDHHHRAGTGTTLFVLNFPFEKDSNVRYKWSTYVSSTGFAWINVNNVFDSMASYVGPNFLSDNTMPPPSAHTDRSGAFDTSGTYQELAVVIHRSIEQLVPSPLPLPSGDVQQIPRQLHIRIFTLCGFPLAKCQPDIISIGAAETLSSIFTNEIVETKYSSTLLRVTDSASVSHSLLSALQKHAAPPHGFKDFLAATGWDNDNVDNSWRNVSVLSTDEFLHWISKSPDVEATMRTDLSTLPVGGVLVPVFSVLLPDEWNVVLPPPTLRPQDGRACGNYRGIHIESEIPTTTGGLPASMISCGKFQMPDAQTRTKDTHGLNPCAVVVLRRDDLPPVVDPAAPSRRGVGRIPPALSTGLHRTLSPLRTGVSDSRGLGAAMNDRVRTALMRDNNFEAYELGDIILQIAWGVPPSYAFYSPSAQQVVRDFLWYSSLHDGAPSGGRDVGRKESATGSEMYNAFRYSRVLKRHAVMCRTNALIERGVIALARAAEVAGSPALAKTISNDLLNAAQKGQLATARSSTAANRFGSGGATTKQSGVPSIVTDISRDIEKISSDYSHLEFDLAYERLVGLEEKVTRLEGMASFGGVGQHIAPTGRDSLEVYGKIVCQPFDSYYDYSGELDGSGNGGESSIGGGHFALILGLLIGALVVLCLIRVNKGGTISVFSRPRFSSRRVVTR